MLAARNLLAGLRVGGATISLDGEGADPEDITVPATNLEVMIDRW